MKLSERSKLEKQEKGIVDPYREEEKLFYMKKNKTKLSI